MKVFYFSRYRIPITLCMMAIIIAAFGCSRSNDTQSKGKLDTLKRDAVSTEGFSFIYKGSIPTTFNEAPELAKRVAAGELPSVEDRLPEEPLIIPPIERIGQYGGTWRRGFTVFYRGQLSRSNALCQFRFVTMKPTRANNSPTCFIDPFSEGL